MDESDYPEYTLKPKKKDTKDIEKLRQVLLNSIPIGTEVTS